MLSIDAHTQGNCFGVGEALKSTFEHIRDALQKCSSSSSGASLPEESVGNITSWKFLFDLFGTDLRLDPLCDELIKNIFLAVSYLLQFFDLFYYLSYPVCKYVI